MTTAWVAAGLAWSLVCLIAVAVLAVTYGFSAPRDEIVLRRNRRRVERELQRTTHAATICMLRTARGALVEGAPDLKASPKAKNRSTKKRPS